MYIGQNRNFDSHLVSMVLECTYCAVYVHTNVDIHIVDHNIYVHVHPTEYTVHRIITESKYLVTPASLLRRIIIIIISTRESRSQASTNWQIRSIHHHQQTLSPLRT